MEARQVEARQVEDRQVEARQVEDRQVKETMTKIDIQNFDIEIKADGRWFHEGGEIKRIGLVKLFASVLSCDEAGRYWLTTPVEKGEIRVEDAPFVIVGLRRKGRGESQSIYLRDNLDQEHLLSKDTPLHMKAMSGQDGGDAKPYILLDKGLSALIKTAVFYEMADIALEAEAPEVSSDKMPVLWSDGQGFSLVAHDDA